MIVLLRLSSELTLKSDQVRTKFLKQLVKNIRDAFKVNHIPLKIQNNWSRIFVEFENEMGIELLKRIFGVSSFSVIDHRCPSDLDTIIKDGIALYKSKMDINKTFAVRARRAGKNLPFNSIDVNQQLGGALNQGKYKVNLSKPDLLIQVEVRPEETYFFSSSIKGACGLPLGTGGRAIALLSGGFDSPVAIWMLQKRGIELDYVLCNMAGDAYERSVIQIAKYLADNWSYGSRPKFHVVNFEKITEDLRKNVDNKFVQVILKRAFIRTANRICYKRKADAIITGEAVAQVSSQTLKNLRSIEAVTKFPILRPLIAMDKEDIINISRHIGTDKFSEKVQEFCQLVPQKPVTACTPEKAEEQEKDINLELIHEAVSTRIVHNLRALDPLDLSMPYISIDRIPDQATIIDCRESEYFEEWHYPNAINMEYYDLLANFKKLVKKNQYVIYCPHGMQSSLVAEKMQTEGYLAYSFKGGIEAIKKQIKS